MGCGCTTKWSKRKNFPDWRGTYANVRSAAAAVIDLMGVLCAHPRAGVCFIQFLETDRAFFVCLFDQHPRRLFANAGIDLKKAPVLQMSTIDSEKHFCQPFFYDLVAQI
jgi:hypothetical protein